MLVVESYPRWEYRYLRNALSRDPGVEVSCLLFHPGLEQSRRRQQGLHQGSFPAGLDELSKFDVVFLGDVGLEDGQLTPNNAGCCEGLVEHQASGLVFMPGWQGRQFSLLETPLGRPLPGGARRGTAGRLGFATPSHFELTELGAAACSPSWPTRRTNNVEVWEDLPGFQWYAPVVRAKAGSEVLCVHKDATNEYGRLPLLVTRTFGAGKVLFMGTDGAWRWRKGVEDKYHYRFWGQVVRWMAYQRNMAKGETMRLYYSPDQPQLRQDGHAQRQRDGTQRRAARQRRRHRAHHRAVRQRRQCGSPRLDDEWGAFTGRFNADEPASTKSRCSANKRAQRWKRRSTCKARHGTGRPTGSAGSARGDCPRHARQSSRRQTIN